MSRPCHHPSNDWYVFNPSLTDGRNESITRLSPSTTPIRNSVVRRPALASNHAFANPILSMASARAWDMCCADPRMLLSSTHLQCGRYPACCVTR